MAESDLPPTHRRRWRWWMNPGFAEVEWRELAALTDDLNRASEYVTRIGQSMGDLPGAGSIRDMGSKLRRFSWRWEKRADQAKLDAIADGHHSYEWTGERNRQINEDLAVTVMSRALTELETAERLLFADEETADRLRKLREPLDDLYAEIHQRDLGRRIDADH